MRPRDTEAVTHKLPTAVAMVEVADDAVPDGGLAGTGDVVDEEGVAGEVVLDLDAAAAVDALDFPEAVAGIAKGVDEGALLLGKAATAAAEVLFDRAPAGGGRAEIEHHPL